MPPTRSRSVLAESAAANPPPAQTPWVPKFPDASSAGPAGRAVPDRLEALPVEWTPAPADSHVLSFRFADGRTNPFLRKFLNGNSYLFVRFKPPPRGGPVTEYQYTYAGPAGAAEGAAVFARLAAHAHPGKVVEQDLIARGTPYERIGAGREPDLG